VARFFHPLILMLASLTCSELARQIQYVKAENEILRAKLSNLALDVLLLLFQEMEAGLGFGPTTTEANRQELLPCIDGRPHREVGASDEEVSPVLPRWLLRFDVRRPVGQHLAGQFA
jgi:hypothetical protein